MPLFHLPVDGVGFLGDQKKGLRGRPRRHVLSAAARCTCECRVYQRRRSPLGITTLQCTHHFYSVLQPASRSIILPWSNTFTCRNCGGGDRGRVAIYRPFGEVSLSLNRTVTCMVLKANDRRTSCPCHDEFRGPRSDYVRQYNSIFSDEESKDEEYNSMYDSATEIDPDLEEGDTFKNDLYVETQKRLGRT
ncbi:uncharacterized protein TNCV_20411 [Trichonephila clavipes]|uniref:Uncharacterized protein n=1 Tax=Trichonephila clavipes TaxID=2585209 RepID=A0A8X6REW1_TRICX|nr:uncharacterized protein TNCV_20411 [Trichonephila clavipes]